MSRDILLTLIDPDPEQPRKYFDAGALAELAGSIGAVGLAVPILLRSVGERFVIVHGERRFRAVLSLGWATIPAEICDLPAEEARWLSLVENVQRQDLTSTEEARAFQANLETGITQAELGRRLGKSQSYIATKLRFLKLPGDVQSQLDAGRLSEGHVKQLLRLAMPEQQSELAQATVTDSWTVQRLKGEVDAALIPFTAADAAELARCEAVIERGIHELGELFPMLTSDDFANLVESVRENGLHNPITLYDGKILDGKMRYAACKVAGVKPRFNIFPDDFPHYRGSALDFVLSANLYRASYNESQRAVMAVRLMEGQHART